MERRKFIQSGAIGVTGLLLGQYAKAEFFSGTKAAPGIGLQLYTLGDLMITDPKGTLQKLAAIGFKEVETAGSQKGNFYGFKPKELAAMIKDAGMTWRSAHVGGAPFTLEQVMKMAKTADDSARIQKMMERYKDMPKPLNLKENYQELADAAAEGGIKYLVCSAIPVNSLDEMKTAVDVFSKSGEACKKVGVQFAYHNHTSEFDEVEGHRPFDYILSNTGKDLVKMELDLAWATKAKQDPVALFKLHPGRFPLWHVKDIDKNTMNPAEVGTGIVDFKRIFDNAKESGMKYFFVEQDGAPQPLQNVTNSYNYLNKLLH
ncbi:sugar phosphate isomerase/epimerase family protein [Flavihumibacter profundi]|jgi:sugar phosphate isomerase/epimerase|uniref:sugar phosphate isomerase/epimerase family protein n=1 Tax=Flavihumibacter profundi TaxID=2716883 RepID=UPI001CC56056|nr:sugar phosphate isomerase/epimerase [Flavihumibacter profundi]MBZ5857335.1 sugar phosphate isomerase/epimerase [Flavihumibacter profundi]